MFGMRCAVRRSAMAALCAPMVAGVLPGVLLGEAPGHAFAQAEASARAANIEGSWQGTLHVDDAHNLRTVIKITKNADGALAGTFFSIDQSPQGIPLSHISFNEGVLKFGITAFDVSYEGKATPDGNTIAGNSTQAGHMLPLNFERATPATAWAMPTPPAPMKPMPAEASPGFDVATIKPSKPDQPGKGLTIDGRKFQTINTSVSDLLTFAYEVQQKQLVNAPDWISTEKFDISGTPDVDGTPNDRQIKGMVKKLLTDRFGLQMHQDKREMSAYVLTVLKTGPKLERSSGGPDSVPGLFFPKIGQLNVMNANMPDFAQLMQSAVLDRPIVDQTGLTGRWNFVLKWTPDETQFHDSGFKVPPPSDAADAPPPLFTAMQEQLGLKLDATRTMVPVLVIDHVTQPSAN